MYFKAIRKRRFSSDELGEEERVRDAEQLGAQEYVYELRQLTRMLTDATSRAEALDQAQKPDAVARAEIGLNMNYLVWLLDRATEEAEETLRAAELVIAIEGIRLEN